MTLDAKYTVVNSGSRRQSGREEEAFQVLRRPIIRIAVQIPDDSVIKYAEEMLVWYDKSATRNRLCFYSLKCVQLVVAGAIPVFSLLPQIRGVQPILSGIAGALLIILEGFQQTFQFQQQWTQYRATWSTLKSEEYLFRAQAGPYKGASGAEATFAERIAGFVSSENKAWQLQTRGPHGKGSESQ
ncbi:MAG: DUF4231 domain-containing protein [Bryobacteraceae bacterium]